MVDWTGKQRNLGHHKHFPEDILDEDTAEPVGVQQTVSLLGPFTLTPDVDGLVDPSNNGVEFGEALAAGTLITGVYLMGYEPWGPDSYFDVSVGHADTTASNIAFYSADAVSGTDGRFALNQVEGNPLLPAATAVIADGEHIIVAHWSGSFPAGSDAHTELFVQISVPGAG